MIESPIASKAHYSVPLPVVLVLGLVAGVASYKLTNVGIEKYLDWRDPLWRMRGTNVTEFDTN